MTPRKEPSMRRIALVVLVACIAVGLVSFLFYRRQEGNMPKTQTTHETAGNGAAGAISSADQAELQRIATLGYISGSEPVSERSGVLLHDRGAAFGGPTLFACSEGSAAVLMDMNGDIIHYWKFPGFKSWGRAHVYENGDLLAITEEYPHIMKLNSKSELLWEWNKAAHHDFDVRPDGTIAVLVSEAVTRPNICDGKPFLADSIILLKPDGTPTRRASILESFERSRQYSGWLEDRIEPGHTDPLHANSVEVFNRDGRRFALVSIRNIDTVAVVDIDASEIVWAITGPWHRQHEARFVGDHILLFDNLGLGDQSRVIEFDTDSMGIVWSFTEPGFFSESEGAQQRLPNGNTLITESGKGRLIEVTRDGRVVWEYVNPLSTMVDGREVVLGIARAERLPDDFPVEWADGGDYTELGRWIASGQ